MLQEKNPATTIPIATNLVSLIMQLIKAAYEKQDVKVRCSVAHSHLIHRRLMPLPAPLAQVPDTLYNPSAFYVNSLDDHLMVKLKKVGVTIAFNKVAFADFRATMPASIGGGVLSVTNGGGRNETEGVREAGKAKGCEGRGDGVRETVSRES